MSQQEQFRPIAEASELSSEKDELFSAQETLETDWFILANQLRLQNQELVFQYRLNSRQHFSFYGFKHSASAG